jgi:hypothetical protein
MIALITELLFALVLSRTNGLFTGLAFWPVQLELGSIFDLCTFARKDD